MQPVHPRPQGELTKAPFHPAKRPGENEHGPVVRPGRVHRTRFVCLRQLLDESFELS